ncbi:MAG: GNAT family N-acetyltransferase, partial [Primorskyibacter sp.]
MTRARHEIPPHAPGAVALSAQMAALVPVLHTDRLVLRAPALADFPVWADIMCGPRSLHLGGPMMRDDAWADFIQLASGWYFHGHGGWTITQGDAVMGFVLLGLEPGDAEPELGFLLCAEAEGHGIAFEAASAARAYAV